MVRGTNKIENHCYKLISVEVIFKVLTLYCFLNVPFGLFQNYAAG